MMHKNTNQCYKDCLNHTFFFRKIDSAKEKTDDKEIEDEVSLLNDEQVCTPNYTRLVAH